MLVTLDQGKIYQHDSPFAGALPPLRAVIDASDPALAYDSFVGQGGLTFEETVGVFGLGGRVAWPSNNIECPRSRFDEFGIDQTWNPAGGVVITDRSEFFVARITLSQDAMGRFHYAGFAGGQDPEEVIRFDAPIVNGLVQGARLIPEPSCFALLLAVAALVPLFTAGRCSMNAAQVRELDEAPTAFPPTTAYAIPAASNAPVARSNLSRTFSTARSIRSRASKPSY